MKIKEEVLKENKPYWVFEDDLNVECPKNEEGDNIDDEFIEVVDKRAIDLTLAEVGKVIDEEDSYQTKQIAKYISALQKCGCFKPKEKREVIAWLTQQMRFKDKVKQKLGIEVLK